MTTDGNSSSFKRRRSDRNLWQEQYYRELSRLDKQKTHSLEELSNRFGPEYVVQAARRFGLWVNGRALQTLKSFLPRRTAEEIVNLERSGCLELTRTSHFHLDLYGNYVPPGCVGFRIDYQHLGEELSGVYPLYSLLVEEGIGGLYEYARKELGFFPDSAGYVSKCDLCYAIRTHLVDASAALERKALSAAASAVADPARRVEAYPELGPLEFYREDGTRRED